MSPWRTNACQLFPDLRGDVSDPGTTVYELFSEFLTRVCEAHDRSDVDEMQRIYGFAEWCFRLDKPELWSAMVWSCNSLSP